MTLQLIRTRRLREEYALVWLGASLAIFIFSIFDRLNIFLAGALGVRYAPTLILVFGLLFCLVLLLSQTVLLSTQANRIRDLAQCIGMLECQIAELEQKVSHTELNLERNSAVVNGHAPEAPLRKEGEAGEAQEQPLEAALSAEL